MLCIITLVVLFFGHGCSPYNQRSGRREELLDSILLIVRNMVQCTRLLSVIRRTGYNARSRVAEINLNDAHGYNLDMDLDQEDALTRQRMLDGSDRPDIDPGWTPQPHVSSQHGSTRPDTYVAVGENDDVVDL